MISQRLFNKVHGVLQSLQFIRFMREFLPTKICELIYSYSTVFYIILYKLDLFMFLLAVRKFIFISNLKQ